MERLKNYKIKNMEVSIKCANKALVVVLVTLITNIVQAQSPSTDQNFIHQRAVLEKGLKTKASLSGQPVSDVNSNITYVDGLGRETQQIGYQASPDSKDVVLPIKYDQYGRQSIEYLPYSTLLTGSTDGSFKSNAVSEQDVFYDDHFGGNTGSYAATQYTFDNSPLNRMILSYAPGEKWSKDGDQRPMTFNYLVNDASDEIIQWEIDNGALVAWKFYDVGVLIKESLIDEASDEVIEFKDKRGLVVLKRVEAPTGWADTYYVYDDFDNLSYVLPPMASDNYASNDLDTPVGYYLVTEDVNYSDISGQAGNKIAYIPTAKVTVDAANTLTSPFHIVKHGIQPSADFLNTWAFQYKYDTRQRLIEKKVPGADVVYSVYDSRNRLVLTQDGNQRASSKWLFTKYDKLNRPIITGEKVITGTLTTIRDNVASHSTSFETYNASGLAKYTNNAYPTGVVEAEIHAVTYYDNYDFTTESFTLPTGIFDDLSFNKVPVEYLASVKGQVTGTKTKILVDTGIDYTETVNFYDDRYRLIQTKILNHKDGNDVFTTQYDFSGKVMKTYLEHNNPSANITNTAIEQKYAYDHAGRLLGISHSIDGALLKIIVSNTYNELGELSEKILSDGYEDIDYTYNIRGWLTKINDLSDGTPKMFEMDVKYDEATNAQYDLKIGEIVWKNPFETITNSYDFTYDKMKRLTSAAYDDAGGSTMDFDIDLVSYDLNGNIQSLKRKGNHDFTANQLFDDLDYDYDGNQLSKVTDTSTKDTGFKDGNTSGDDYSYDANGNMNEDKNKGIASIEYNHMNLPKKVTIDGSNYVEFTYDATGTKMSQKEVKNGIPTTTDYSNGFVYVEDKLQFIHHNEGRVEAKYNTSGTFTEFEYQYHLKDHLGNVRATFKPNIDVDPPYTADFETASATYESTYFSRYGEITRINADLLDHTDTGSSNYSMRLNGTGDEVEGLAKSLMVKPGDIIEADVYVKYIDPNNQGTGSFATLISNLASNASSVVTEGVTAGTDPMPFTGLMGYGTDVSDGPKAYLNILVFDQNYELLTSAFEPVTSNAEEDGTDIQHEHLSRQITIGEPGYVYIYLSNENPTKVEVFFDDFEITQTHSPIVHKNDYYPFGFSYQSYTRPGTTAQNYKYNGKESIKALDIDWIDYGARMYDPVLGRWHVPDPHADLYEAVSPYAYAFNNPILFLDPDGRDNTIYLILVDEKEREEAETIAEQANILFGALGLKTRVKVYNSAVYGKFYQENIDKTDNWAVIGKDRKEVGRKASEIDPRWNTKDWIAYGGPGRASPAGDQGAVIHIDDASNEAIKRGKVSSAVWNGLSVAHESGHSSNRIDMKAIKEGDIVGKHLQTGVMLNATSLRQRYIHNIGSEITSKENNKTYILGMEERYGTNEAKDNYFINMMENMRNGMQFKIVDPTKNYLNER